MKVTFIRHSLLNRGGDKMIIAQANYLAEAGHNIILAVNEMRSLLPLADQVTVHCLSGGKVGTLLAAATRHACDAVVADIIPLAVLLCLRNRGRVVYYAQDYDEEYYSGPLMRMFVRLLYWCGLRLCGIPVIAVSAALAGTFHRRFGVQPFVVENGIDLSVFYRDPDEGRMALKEGRHAVLALSRADFRKGFDTALLAFRRLQECFPGNVELWTVGDDAALPPEITLHRHFGWVRPDELRKIFSSADVFLYPTRHEGFGLMVAEAFACGCPVVTTPAVPFAEDGVNALLAAADDVEHLTKCVELVLRDVGNREKLRENAGAFVSRLSLAENLRLFEETLRDVVS